MNSSPRVPEPHKRPGLHYAFTDDGIELAVIDVTHPAFAASLDPAEQRRRTDEFFRQNRPFNRLPAPLRGLIIRLLLRKSVLGRALTSANGTFLPGMSTYLLKLGADNLGSAFQNRVDRKIAGALPALLVRVRLQDVAELLVSRIAPLLESSARPLRFLNIAGGPAMDSLNALLLLRRDRPALLDGRKIAIDVLDLDQAGPSFGRRALAALQAEGAPLHGLAIEFRHQPYDWSRPAGLDPALAAARADHAILAVSSEGGLFEYGSDDEIVANLTALAQGGPADLFVAGSVTRADEPIHRLHSTRGPATRPRGLPRFTELAARAHFTVSSSVERVFSDQVLLAGSPFHPAHGKV